MDDEIHFICDCNLLTSARSVFHSKVISMCPSFESLNSKEKFTFIFSSDDPILLTWLGKFIVDGFTLKDHELIGV